MDFRTLVPTEQRRAEVISAPATVEIRDGAGVLIVEDTPSITPEEIARVSALAKLQALGLTESEALALFNIN